MSKNVNMYSTSMFYFNQIKDFYFNVIKTKFWVAISIWRFVDQYDEFWGDLFTKSYQESEIFLMVKCESVCPRFWRPKLMKTFGTCRTKFWNLVTEFCS